MVQTLEDLKGYLRQTLEPVTVSPEQTSAEINLLLKVLLGVTPTEAFANPQRPLPPHTWDKVEAFLRRRVGQRIPIQYLFSEACFYGLTLHVSPSVLIPRPETELLVEEAVNLCATLGYRSVLDIGTGSGAIALALAHTLRDAVTVTATDASAMALVVATHNAQFLGLNDVRFLTGDLFAPVAGECFDLIVSNPPYIDPALKPTLAPEVLEHEPHEALFAENEGYAFYERMAAEAGDYLNPGGGVLVELGQGMAPRVAEIFKSNGFEEVRLISDYAGIERVLHGSGR